jgi:ATP-binding cassette subfamily C protein LapB
VAGHSLGRQMVSLRHVSGLLRLEEASFVYPRAQAAVQPTSLTIQPGERLGIIGSVGSGKSTLLRMLSGLYAPTQGLTLLDGIDMTQVVEADLQQHVCYLPQHYRLIGGTLRDNLVFGVADASDEYLLDAAARTGLGELIRKHPQGLDMVINEGGRGLSGGQAALVGLTRILLLKPQVALLDEPTAALDQDNEARVLHAIFLALGETSTIVLVTHKIPLLSLVRRLIVMANGKIALDGPTQSVIDRLRAPTPSAVKARPVVGGVV